MEKGCLVIGSPRSGTTLCASMIGVHPDIGMHFEDTGHGRKEVLGAKIWGNKLCVPNQITLDPRPDDRSIWTRLEDGIRAVIGRPRWLPRLQESYPVAERQQTIRTYVEQGACIVAMLREPDHVVDSIRRRGNLSVERGKYRWSRAIRDIHQAFRAYEERMCLIRFIDLVNDPESAMQTVCALLGLHYSARMPEGYRHTPQYNHNNLDPSVATRDVPNYRIEEFDPSAFEMYTELVQHATENLKTTLTGE